MVDCGVAFLDVFHSSNLASFVGEMKNRNMDSEFVPVLLNVGVVFRVYYVDSLTSDKIPSNLHRINRQYDDR